MTTHRWIHSTPRVRTNGERIERGDEFEATDHELRCWPDRIEELPTCDVEKADGEICGRELPCAYHPDEEAE